MKKPLNEVVSYSNKYSSLNLKMKFSILFFIITLIRVQADSGYAQNTKISLNADNITVLEVIDRIESNTEFKFFYSNEELELDRKISIHVKNKNIKEVINLMFGKGKVSFKIIDRHIVISKINKNSLDEIRTGLLLKKAESTIQQIEIEGIVTDLSGVPLAGANIIEKGTSNGSQTDFDGNFKLSVTNTNAILVISYIGFATQEISIDGKTNFEIVLKEDTAKLDEIVVTALGISREKKALGYAVQEVQGEIFEKTKELDLNNSLNGRVSGVFISQGRSNLGTSNARVVIRGESSIGGNNNPLYIVDGFPASYVNPNDIESLSVLKGPAATALYGSRAAAGVIVITTKSGKRSEVLSIEVASNVTISNPSVLPDYQTEYGQGLGGVYNPSISLSWGPAFTEPAIQQLWGGNEWRAYPNAIKEAYNTGVTLNNNVALSGGNEKSDFRLSYTNVDQTGMIPNTKFNEHTIDLNTSRNFTDKFSVRAGVKYRLSNTPNNGSFDPRFIPLNVNPDALKNYLDENGNQVLYRQQVDNPYFTLNEDQNITKNKNLFLSLDLNYKFNDFLNLQVRSAAGINDGKNEYRGAFGHAGVNRQFGSYRFNKYSSSESNTDFLLTYKKDFNAFSVKTSVGANHLQTNRENISVQVNQLLTEGSYTVSNYRQLPITRSSVGPKKIVNSLYAYANLGYKNLAYLDLTIRNDWSSSLPKANNSFSYPSASLSLLAHNMLDLPKTFNFWKIRANYAQVGNDTDPGRLQMLYFFTQGTGGVAGIDEENTFPELNLKPELSTAYEFGTEFKFFNNRLNLDFTYYNSVTENQIWRVPLSEVSGYNFAIKNVGKVESKGFEVSLGATLIKSDSFTWRSNINWSSDRSVVQELDPNNPELEFTQQVASNTFIIDRVNQRRGQIYSKTARRFVYDPQIHNSSLQQYNGMMYHDSAKDLPRVAELSVIGNVNPDWIAGWENNFTYKGWSLGALVTSVYGNSFYAGFEKDFVGDGFDPITAGDRSSVLPDGIWDSPTGIRPFAPGDEITADQYYGDYLTDGEINDIWVRDGSYVKIKEVSLSYSLPSKLLSNLFIKEARFTLLGRNLYTFSDVKYIDPEIFVNNGGLTTAGISVPNTLPLARTWAFNINLRF
ncbi:SusC/RagA family TonB-linked outer membrane protein [Aestuariivivens sp. NBU2969]|uniref:SusC/RagA family TonB-linked outer membrane protein n=1 Tax=Aestuariivivens sp. NBU2969 TaxID=2873267 RepID=UPI001CBDFB7E|nr:SusC/RagA family TonB-linked outer membrane protein [Aestuariivivens sp. NBU2969]